MKAIRLIVQKKGPTQINRTRGPSWVLALLVLFLAGISQSLSGQGIHNSHHDFPNEWKGTGRNCMPCHFPKDTLFNTDKSHYWSKRMDSLIYQVFSVSEQDGAPGGNSKLCLSCHDGSVAHDNHLNKSYSTKEGGFRKQMDFSPEHPVSVSYPTTGVRDKKLRDPRTTMSGLGGSIDQDLLSAGRVECTSCHDVHLARNTQGCIGCHRDGNFKSGRTMDLSLRVSNTHSALCLTCHIK